MALAQFEGPEDSNQTKGLGTLLSKENVDVEAMVRRVAIRGKDELQNLRTNIAGLSLDVTKQLKTHINKNSLPFMQIAKEMAALNDDLHKVDDLFSEQRATISALQELVSYELKDDFESATSITKEYTIFIRNSGRGSRPTPNFLPTATCLAGEAIEAKGNAKQEEESRKRMFSVLEMVDGCSSLLGDPKRYLLHAGDVLELDTDVERPDGDTAAIVRPRELQLVRLFLLSDCLLTTVIDRHFSVTYRLEQTYELENVGILNVPDSASVHNAFKLLKFPETRLFQCEDIKSKRKWIESIERAKSAFLLEAQQATLIDDNDLQRSAQPKAPARHASKATRPRPAPSNPFDEEEQADADKKPNAAPFSLEALRRASSMTVDGLYRSMIQSQRLSAPATRTSRPLPSLEEFSWISSLPEDLVVYMEQRQFEPAANDIIKARKLFELWCGVREEDSTVPQLNEIRRRVEAIAKRLVEYLVAELQPAPDSAGGAPMGNERRVVRGGLKATKSAVNMLINLNKAFLACQMLLEYRSAVIKSSLSLIIVEDRVATEVLRKSEKFFDALGISAAEFKSAFHNNQICYSYFVTWMKNEIADFLDDHVRQQRNFSNDNFATIATCVQEMRNACSNLSSRIELDLSWYIDAELEPDIIRLINEQSQHLTEAADRRAAEDHWQPHMERTPEQLHKFVQSMTDSNVPKIKEMTYSVDDRQYIRLTFNTLQFAKSYMIFVENVLKLYTPEIHTVAMEALGKAFYAQLKHFKRSFQTPAFVSQRAFIIANLKYLSEELVPAMREALVMAGLFGGLANTQQALSVANASTSNPLANLLTAFKRAELLYMSSQSHKV